MILHLSQIGFTDGLTFILKPLLDFLPQASNLIVNYVAQSPHVPFAPLGGSTNTNKFISFAGVRDRFELLASSTFLLLIKNIYL